MARQYCGARGKRTNCQALVSLTLAKGEVAVSVGLRLFLSEAWVVVPGRCARAGVPEEHRRALAKASIALEEIDRVLAAGARSGTMLADAGYGTSAACRQSLNARGLAQGGRRPEDPERLPARGRAALAQGGHSWRRGSKGSLAAQFAALRIRPAEGQQPRNRWHLPGEKVGLLGERRAGGERKHSLAKLPVATPLAELTATIKARPRPAVAGRACGNGWSAPRSLGGRGGAPTTSWPWAASRAGRERCSRPACTGTR
jgi:hypothetical protein